jgi:acetyl esterase
MSYAFDPEFEPHMPAMAVLPLEDLAGTRALIDQKEADTPPPDTTGLEVTDRLIPGPPDAPEVSVRLYRPLAGHAGSAILFLHAGGLILGGLESEHPLCTSLARELSTVVVSVDYRLAPEHPYPAAIDDSYAAFTWLFGSADELGVDTRRVAVVGRSAGGGLAAALTLMARDRRGPQACFQYLDVPMLDDRMDSATMRSFTDAPVWDPRSSEIAWRHYLGDQVGGDQVSPYAAPARAEDLSGLPPAYVHTAQFDPLRDEGIAYALRLLGTGIPTELHSSPGTFHGSEMAPDTAISRRIASERLEILRRALA